MDLRRSAVPSSLPASTIAIPAARPPFQPLTRATPPAVAVATSPRVVVVGTAFRHPSAGGGAATSEAHLWHLVEGAFVLVGAYILIGAGIGDVAGSVMIGVAAGFISGVGALAAILLISGCAHAAHAAHAARPAPDIGSRGEVLRR